MKMKNYYLSLAAIILITIPNWLSASNGHFKDTLTLLEVTGSLKMGQQLGQHTAQQILKVVKQQQTDIPPEAFSIIEEETMRIITSELAPDGKFVKELVDLQNEYFTHEEIKELLAFYDTDIGKKLIATQPEIFQKSMLIGQIWGKSLIPLLKDRILTRLKQEGIKIE